VLVAATGLRIPKAPKLADLAEFPWVLNETGCGFRTYLRRVFESRRLPFQVGVEASSADMRLSLVARGHGIGVVTAAALVKSPWRKLVRVIKSADFEPQVRAWLVHRPPAGRLATALEVFRAALLEALWPGQAPHAAARA
jgi:DNA-binding transcriptional LysR family regulator